MPEKLSSLLDRIIFYGILFLIFFIPIFFSRFFDLFHLSLPWLYTNLVFNLPKAVLFQAIVDILLLLAAVDFLFFQKKQETWHCHVSTEIFVVISACLLVNVLATVFSAVPLISFFGQYERSQGLLISFHYLGFFFLLTRYLRREQIPTILFTIVFSALLVDLYAVLQGLGLDPITAWAEDVLQGRVFSTLGHPNYLGYYLIFTLPVTGYVAKQVFFSTTLTSHPSSSPRRDFGGQAKGGKLWMKLIVSLSLLFQIFALFLSGSRGAFLGLIGGLLVTLLIYVWKTKQKKVFQKTFWGILILCLLALGFFTVRPDVLAQLRFNAENLRSVESRLVIWQDTLRMIAVHPFWGYGLDTYYLYYPQFKSPALLDLENYNLNADRAHNILLDMLQSTGLAGLAVYLLLFFVLLQRTTRLFSTKDRSVGFLLMTIFLSFFLANLWGFPVVVHDIYFWLCIGILVLLSGKEGAVTKRFFYKISAVFIFLGASLSLFLQINSYHTDHLFLENGSNLENTQLNPFVPAYGYSVAAGEGDSADAALRHLQNLTRGEDYQVELLQADRWNRAGKTEAAQTRYQQLAEKYPAIPAVYLAWGNFEKEQNNFTACSGVYQKLLQLSPNYWQYDDNIATQPIAVQERYRIFFKENPTFRNIFINLSWCMFQSKDFTAVLQYALHMLNSPQKYQWLGTAAAQTGQPEAAQKYFEICRQLSDNEMCQKKI